MKTLIYIMVVIVAIIIRLFIANIYSVPSPSMSPTIKTGDYIIASKISYGSRQFYYGQADWIGKHVFFDANVARKDIVVFNLPRSSKKQRIPERIVLVKRCVALPGDTVAVNGDKEYVNTKDIDGEQQNYFGLPKPDPQIMPYDTTFGWSVVDFGPVVVPAKGDSVLLNHHNIVLYGRVLKVHEENIIEEKGDTVFVNGQQTKYYHFKQNYYFMLGDNRMGSEDSRFWGFVPETCIIGKVVLTF